jgi:cytochrome c oxidase cbb3-type subunit 3
MADFVDSYWGWFVFVPTVISLVALIVFTGIFSGRKKTPGEKAESVGHVWDEDLHELNNPLPRWWVNLFYITLVFSAVYLVFYPGLGSFEGVLGWSQTGQYDEEVKAADAAYGPLFEKYLARDLKTVAADPEATRIGARLYANYCTGCHGSDARGARGFPDLRDGDWLFGGEPEAIKTSIMEGRQGMMPAWEESLEDEGVRNVAEYVLGLSGRQGDAEQAAKGKVAFEQSCVACHGAEGKGNLAMGGPNLTDGIWLYGGAKERVMHSIAEGRRGNMPAHGKFLGEAKVHLLAAYVYGLAGGAKK